jgi:23S rRNA pseudouridine1911/1915/1917 synthase
LRLDVAVAQAAGCTRREAQRLIEEGRVRVDGRARALSKGTFVEAGAAVDVEPPGDSAPIAEPELPLTVLHQDARFVFVDKPAGMATHPLRPGERGTLANALVARFPECAAASAQLREGGVGHRLDHATTGVLVAARSREAWTALRAEFAGGRVEKTYWALVVGDPPERGEIFAALAHAGQRVTTAPRANSMPAETRFVVLQRGPSCALVEAVAHTGRMHQIRAHLAHLGHPLVGDELYGGPVEAGGHVLHARRLVVDKIAVEAPWPAARRAVVERFLGAGATAK